MIRSSKVILIDSEKKILLQMRPLWKSHAWKWSAFGGHVDEWETPDEALVREIQEELSYDVKNYMKFDDVMAPWFGMVRFYYAPLTCWLDDLVLGEWDEMWLFSYEDLSSVLISPVTKSVIDRMHENDLF